MPKNWDETSSFFTKTNQLSLLLLTMPEKSPLSICLVCISLLAVLITSGMLLGLQSGGNCGIQDNIPDYYESDDEYSSTLTPHGNVTSTSTTDIPYSSTNDIFTSLSVEESSLSSLNLHIEFFLIFYCSMAFCMLLIDCVKHIFVYRCVVVLFGIGLVTYFVQVIWIIHTLVVLSGIRCAGHELTRIETFIGYVIVLMWYGLMPWFVIHEIRESRQNDTFWCMLRDRKQCVQRIDICLHHYSSSIIYCFSTEAHFCGVPHLGLTFSYCSVYDILKFSLDLYRSRFFHKHKLQTWSLFKEGIIKQYLQ